MPALDALFVRIPQMDASDLHLSAGLPVKMRVHGELQVIDPRKVSGGQLEQWLKEIVSDAQWRRFLRTHELDFSYGAPRGLRLRASYLRHQGGVAAVFRTIPPRVLSAADLGLPAPVVRFARAERGLVLVTGPTGSGKSTTLAALVDDINTRCARHIILIEDPIEFLHVDKRSAIVQREVGSQTSGFARALRAALRQDPDVILVGELRDADTMSLALDAAEMGFLVFGTLHTNGAAKTVDRVVDIFDEARQPAARIALASTLTGVVSQLLMPRADGKGRIAMHEVLVGNSAVRTALRAGDTPKIHSIMQTSSQSGMQTMDQALMAALEGGAIRGEEAWTKAHDRGPFARFAPREGV